VVSDSIVPSDEFKKKVGDKLEVVSLDLLLAEAIRRVDGKEDLKDLFEKPLY